MADLEQVLKALRTCSPGDTIWCQMREKGECDYAGEHCMARLLSDAAEMLTPRVLTLEEIMMFDGAFIIEYNPERLSRDMNWAMFHFMDERWIHLWRPRLIEHYARNQYGVTWRAWTSRPSDAQRAAEPWEEVRS